MAWLGLVRSHEHYQKRAEISAQNLCTVLADTLVTSYEKIDIALLDVKAELERQLASGQVDGPSIETFIKRQRTRIPGLSNLRTVQADGFVAFGNDASPGARINLADRDCFLRLKSDPHAGLVFSKPVMGRVQVTPVVMLARRINGPNGTFAGLVYSAIILNQLDSHFASVAIGREDTITLRDADLALILRHGGPQDRMGRTTVSPAFRALVQAGQSSGTYSAVALVDGVARVYAFIKLTPYGQYIHVGLGQREILEPWRRELRQTLGFVTLFLLFIAASSCGAFWVMRRQRQADAERERLILALQKALAEVTTLSGLIPICSTCKKIRDDTGYWSQIETYIASHSAANFTHSICPECAKCYFPELFEPRAAGQDQGAKLRTRLSRPSGFRRQPKPTRLGSLLVKTCLRYLRLRTRSHPAGLL